MNTTTADLARDMAARMIRRHEGRRLTVYDDKTGQSLKPGDTLVGHPSIGYGRCLDLRRGITGPEAEYLLDNDMAINEAVAKQFAGPICWARLGCTRQAVLMDMAHNLGPRGLATFVRFRQALHDGDYSAAADEMLASKWAVQVGDRARDLAAIMKSGEWVEGV